MQKTPTLLLLALLSIIFGRGDADAQLHYLNKIYSNAEYTFKNVENGAALYVASNDNSALLKNMTVQIGNKTYSLDQFATATNNDGSQVSLSMTGQTAIFSSTLDDSSTNTLTGFLYFTTAAQAKDPNFSVIVVQNQNTIRSTQPQGVESTIVVLNTGLNMPFDQYPPPRTSRVSNITQPETTVLKIFRGVPGSNATDDEKTKRIFINPLTYQINDNNGTLHTNTQFFKDIVPMQLDLQCWYIKSIGSFSLVAQRQWDTSRKYYATALTTTGLIVNEYVFSEIDVFFTINPANSRIVGEFSTLSVEEGQAMSIIFQDSLGTRVGKSQKGPTMDYKSSYVGEFQAVNLTVQGTIIPGSFYIQYFGIDGPPLPSTLSPPTVAPTSPASSTKAATSSNSTTAPVWTTTKSTTRTTFLISTVLIFICQLVMH